MGPLSTSVCRLPSGRAWEFPREPRLGRQLEELVTFERVCCPGLGWELRPVRETETLRLEVTGFDPGPGALPEAEEPGRGRVVAIAGAVGLAVSVCLLCALPIVLAAGGPS